MKTGRAGISDWISAFRLRTLPLALSSILAGAASSGSASGEKLPVLFLAMLTTILLQILSNLSNDYGDSVHGADNEHRKGPLRAVQSGRIRAHSMKIAIGLFAVLALTSGVWLLSEAIGAINAEFMVFLAAGILAIIAAIRYTAGPKPYGYRGYGDLSVFLFFGITGVCGSAYLFSGGWNNAALFPAAAIGLLSAAVLNLNNMRDRENDRASHKITLAVRLGRQRSKVYHMALVLAAWIALGIFLALQGCKSGHALLAVPLIVQMMHLRRVFTLDSDTAFDKELPKVALTTFLIALILILVDIFAT